jgi:ribose transport system permease protein
MTMIIISGGIDLAVGSTIALTGVITALGIHSGLVTLMALAAGILVGGLVGVVQWTCHHKVESGAVHRNVGHARSCSWNCQNGVAGEQTVNMADTWLNGLLVMFPNPSWLLVAPGVWITIVLAICAAVVLRNTVFGRRVFALGSNEAAARACESRRTG